MNLTFNRVEFAKALFCASHTLGTAKSINKFTTEVQFLFENKKLFLYTSDGNNFSEVLFGDVDASDYSFTVNFELLNKTVLDYGNETIDLVVDNGSLIITDGESEYRMQTANSFNNSPLFKNLNMSFAKPINIELANMRSAVSFTSVCMATQTELSHLKGAYFDGNFVATDTKKLAIYPYSKSIASPVFLSGVSVYLLASLSDIYTDVMLYGSKDKCVIVADNSRYILSVMVKDFPGYKKVVKEVESHIHTFRVNKETLRKKCKRLVPYTDTKKKGTATFTVTKDKLTIEVASETKRGKETIDIASENIDSSFDLDIGLASLLNYLTHLSGDEVTISFDDNLKLYKIWSSDPFFVETLYKF